MPEKTVAQKLMIKPGKRVLALNAPEGYLGLLGELPAGVTVLPGPSEQADTVLLFVRDRAELERYLEPAKAYVDPAGMLWVFYYKGTSKHKSDIHRDTINAYAQTLGLQGVFMISADEDWSAMRLKVV